MKRLLTSAALFLCSLLTFAQFTGTRTDSQGVMYTANDDGTTCFVSGHSDEYKSEIVIPEVYEGLSVTSIGSWAFYSSNITSLTIPSGVTSIGDYAFHSCSSLTSLTIPFGVTSIGNGAFKDCSSLTSVTIPSSVTSIGQGAFCYCRSLTSLAIPSSVTSIADHAFSECSSLTSLTIPSSMTSIADYTFERCNSLTSLTIPSSITSIGVKAFYGCSNLTSLTIPSSVTSIGISAFLECSGLKTITVEEGNTVYDSRENCNAIIRTADNSLFFGCQNTVIPASVTSIDYSAFSRCSGLTSLTIPEGVLSIGDYAFEGCSNLTSLTVKWLQPISIPMSLFYTSGGHSFYASNAILIVPKGSKALYKEAEVWKRFRSIMEPFEGTLTDSQGVKYTANNDDWTCRVSGHEKTYDANVTIPEIYEGRTVTSIGSEAFSGCSELASVTTPSSMTSIGDNAFAGCNSLEWLDVDWTTPLDISADAFNNSNYQNATLCVPIDSKTVYEKANVWKDFKEIVALFRGTVTDSQGVKYTANNGKATCFVSSYNKNDNSNSIVTIPETYGGRKVTSIGDEAFRNCNRLTSVIIPEGVESIGSYAFANCI